VKAFPGGQEPFTLFTLLTEWLSTLAETAHAHIRDVYESAGILDTRSLSVILYTSLALKLG
jgi:hypothetical protein